MVADILLADCAGTGWLVRGEQYLNDFLANTLPPSLSVEVVSCESRETLMALREQVAGPLDTQPVMWVIHPAILNRARGRTGDLCVTFASWSAAMNADSTAAIRTAAQLASERPDHAVVLVRHLPDPALPMLATMADLRCAMIEAQLTELGVPIGRMTRETILGATAEQSERVGLLVRQPSGGEQGG